MCETCGRELHHPLAPSRRKFILGAAAIGLAFVFFVFFVVGLQS